MITCSLYRDLSSSMISTSVIGSLSRFGFENLGYRVKSRKMDLSF